VDTASVTANPDDPEVRTWYQATVVVELAPDTLMETPSGDNGANWPAIGLGYYRGLWPRKLKTTTNRNDPYCMDFGMKSAFEVGVDRHLPALPDTKAMTMNPSMSYPTPPSNNSTSVGTAEFMHDWSAPLVVPIRWVDYRGVSSKPLDSAQYDQDALEFYKERDPGSASSPGRQTSKRVVIRSISTLNQGM
jgi:hypothetical protein